MPELCVTGDPCGSTQDPADAAASAMFLDALIDRMESVGWTIDKTDEKTFAGVRFFVSREPDLELTVERAADEAAKALARMESSESSIYVKHGTVYVHEAFFGGGKWSVLGWH